MATRETEKFKNLVSDGETLTLPIFLSHISPAVLNVKEKKLEGFPIYFCGSFLLE